MKKKWLVVIIMAVFICASAVAVWANEPIKLVVNGQEIKPDVSPQIISNRTMVPVRWIAEALGAHVEWDAQSKTVFITTSTNSTDNQDNSDETEIIKPVEEDISNPELAEKIIKESADKLVYALKTKDTTTIANFTHPVKGVRFTPYTNVSLEHDMVFSKEAIKNFFTDQKVYLWGYFDGSGEEIKLTPSQYYNKFIYDQDYITAEKVGYNEVLSSGNMLENQFEIYENAIVVEYYFSGFNPDYEGLDWRSLRLVFEPYENDWKLVGIINNQWTI